RERGLIDYDHRGRSRKIETDLEEATLFTKTVIAYFEDLNDADCRREIKAAYSVGYGDREAHVIPTNLEREIAYCVSHAVHHFAIMRFICTQQAIQVPAEFGIAPSTLKYRAAHAAN